MSVTFHGDHVGCRSSADARYGRVVIGCRGNRSAGASKLRRIMSGTTGTVRGNPGTAKRPALPPAHFNKAHSTLFSRFSFLSHSFFHQLRVQATAFEHPKFTHTLLRPTFFYPQSPCIATCAPLCWPPTVWLPPLPSSTNTNMLTTRSTSLGPLLIIRNHDFPVLETNHSQARQFR